MRKEVTVLMISVPAIVTDCVSGWQIFDLWQSGEVNLEIAQLCGILTGQMILAIAVGWLSVILLRKILRTDS